MLKRGYMIHFLKKYGACQERLAGFAKIGQKDPAKYVEA
jgi:hypothetical protein